MLPPGACIIKPFTAIINFVVQYASAFAIVSHFLLALTNSVAFYVTKLITAVISFMIQAPGGRKWQLIYPNGRGSAVNRVLDGSTYPS